MSFAENLVSGSCDDSQNPIKHILSNVESNLQNMKHSKELNFEGGSISSGTLERKMMERSRILSKQFYHDKDDQFVEEQLSPFFQKMNIVQNRNSGQQSIRAPENSTTFSQQPKEYDELFDLETDFPEDSFKPPLLDNELDYVQYFKRSFDIESIKKSTMSYQYSVEYQENPFKNHDDAYDLGMSLWKKGELRNSILAFEAAAHRFPKNFEVWKMLGTVNSEAENDERAIQAYTKAFSIDPTNIDVILGLGVSHTNELNKIRALVFFSNWIENNPKYAEIVKSHPSYQQEFDNDEQLLAWKFSQFDQAVISVYDSAAKAFPDDINLQKVLAVLYSIADNLEDAIQCLRKILAVNPNDATIWNRLGATLANHHKSDEAIECYRRALKIKPSYIRVWFNLGIVHSNCNRHVEALKFYFRALKMSESNEHIWNYISISLTCLQRDDLTALCEARDMKGLIEKFPPLQE